MELTASLLHRLDHLGNFFCGDRGPLCQLPHFVGDHGKTAALFAGAGGFYGGIQCEQVGLVRNIVDDANDASDLV
jgi:hypothetical protein